LPSASLEWATRPIHLLFYPIITLIAVGAQFEERFYQGMPSGVRLSAKLETSFSRWGVGQVSAAKAAYLRAIIGIAEAMP
jgi:hypothetical protein